MDEVYLGIMTLRRDVEAALRPTGSRANPALTCRDLFLAFPNSSSG